MNIERAILVSLWIEIRDDRIKSMWPYAIAMARKYIRCSIGLEMYDDIIESAALEGVMNAANKYKEGSKKSFKHLAIDNIRWNIHRSIRSYNEGYYKIGVDGKQSFVFIYNASLDEYHEYEDGEQYQYEQALMTYTNFDDGLVAEHINDVINSIPNRYKKVIVSRYWEDETFEEIGNMLGVTRQRVKQIEERAKEVIKRMLFKFGDKYEERNKSG